MASSAGHERHLSKDSAHRVRYETNGSRSRLQCTHGDSARGVNDLKAWMRSPLCCGVVPTVWMRSAYMSENSQSTEELSEITLELTVLFRLRARGGCGAAKLHEISSSSSGADGCTTASSRACDSSDVAKGDAIAVFSQQLPQRVSCSRSRTEHAAVSSPAVLNQTPLHRHPPVATKERTT